MRSIANAGGTAESALEGAVEAGVVASFFIPGPEDLIIEGVLATAVAKKGIALVFDKGSDLIRFCFKNGDGVGRELTEAELRNALGSEADEIYDAVKMELKVLQDGCFVAGTLVQIASVAQPVLQIGGESASDWWNSIEVHDSLALPIEDVPLGARIATKNPNQSDLDDSLPEPDSTWKLVRMQFQRKNGSRVDIELLRPVDWIERHRLAVGEPIFMSNAEIEVRGTCRVLVIEDCPPIADGEGAVVISRIKTHHAGDLIQLQFENGETLTGTASHPIWSADRQDWVPLGELQEGEHTQSRDGLLKITRRTALPDMQPVYNIEVHGEHVYEVTRAGVLVHNNAPDCLQAAIDRGMKVLRGPTAPDEMVGVLQKLGRPMSRERIGDVIHLVKAKMNIGAAEDVVFDLSGGMWDSRTGEYIGKMWEAF